MTGIAPPTRAAPGTWRNLPYVRATSAERLPPPRIARTTVVPNAATAASILMGLGVFAAAPLRGRTDEIIAGAVLLGIAVALGIRVARASRATRAVPALAALGWAAQASASLVYYYTDFAVDARTYHRLAELYATGAVAMTWPDSNWGVEGIVFVLTGLYRVTGPSMLLGFVVFAFVGLVGKLLLAATLLRLRGVLGAGAEVGAVMLLVLPSLNLWLGAISKESLAILGIGLVLSGLIRIDRPPDPVRMAVGLVLITLVRAHIALLLSAAVVVYQVMIIALPRRRGGGRVLPLVAGGALLAASLLAAASYLGTDADLEGLESRRIALSAISSPGGSTIEPVPIRSPLDVPAAVSNVVLRPFPWEAYNLTTTAQAVESVAIVGGTAWLATQGRRRRRNARRGADALQLRALRLFGVTYVSGFVFAFSITYNLGLISRQRAQLWLPAAVLVATAFVRAGRGGPASPRSDRPQPARAAPHGPSGSMAARTRR